MDNLLTLAWSIQKNPGVYALLLGSGISRSVGIPTGWEITQDLIKQVKEASGEELPEDTGYDQLIGALGKTATERNAILRQYFEPTEDERIRGIKVPSPAHRAIARLVQDGFIKVILTTNFDRLMEIALEEIGIIAGVIRSEDMLNGSIPLRHSRITIIQLHGDYQDTRTLNTTTELASYSAEKTALLETVFSEYGVVICGWSAKYDTALRDSLLRVKQRWYSTYWIEPYDLSPVALEVVRQRQAEVIQQNADECLTVLQQTVEVLSRLNAQHPLTAAVAVERAKKLIPREEAQLELEDLLRNESERAFQVFGKHEFPVANGTPEEVDKLYTQFLSDTVTLCEVPLKLLTTVCWYGMRNQTTTISQIMERWSTPKNIHDEPNSGRLIPSLLMLYAGGIAATFNGNWEYFAALILRPRVHTFRNSDRISILDRVHKYRIFERGIYRQTFNDHDPMSVRLKHALRDLFASTLPIERDYEEAFNLFEMLLALVSYQICERWVPHNAYLDEYIEYNQYGHIVEFWREGAKLRAGWDFLREVFEGKQAVLQSALEKYQAYLAQNQGKIYVHPKNSPDYYAIYRDNSGIHFG